MSTSQHDAAFASPSLRTSRVLRVNEDACEIWVEQLDPGTRAYASAGLPGADWWVAASANTHPETVDVELDEVESLYTENNLWSAVFAAST